MLRRLRFRRAAFRTTSPQLGAGTAWRSAARLRCALRARSAAPPRHGTPRGAREPQCASGVGPFRVAEVAFGQV